MSSPEAHAAADLAQAALKVAAQPGLPVDLALAYSRQAEALAPGTLAPIAAALAVLDRAGDVEAAETWADRGLALAPFDPALLVAKARALEFKGEFDFAAAYCARAHALTGGQDLQLGRTLMNAGRLGDAAAVLEAGHAAAEPGSRHQAWVERVLGETLLRAGRVDGFRLWRERDRTDGGRFHLPATPDWAGESLEGRLLLVTHQLGFGDQLLLAPMAAQLARWGARLVLTCDEAVRDVLSESLPEVRIVATPRPTRPAAPPPPGLLALVAAVRPDLHASLLDVAARLDEAEIRAGLATRLRSPPAARAWAVDEGRRLRAAHPGKRLIALAFDCVQHRLPELGAYDRRFAERRSIPLKGIGAVTANPEVAARAHFVCLHPPDHLELIGGLPPNCSAPGWTSHSFGDTAALIEAADGVVTVDTAVANLAPLLGAPTWVLLNHQGDWRWGAQGERSPWMTGPRLLRQPVPGLWSPVLRALREALREDAETV